MAMRVGLFQEKIEKDDSNEVKYKKLGWNVGNAAFLLSLQRLFEPENVGEEAIAQNGTAHYNIDKWIVCGLSWLQEHAERESMESIVDHSDATFIPMSVGLQSDVYDPHFQLSAQVVRLLKKMEERAVLGVRGEYTADILNKYGIKNISVIGCPSMFYWNNPSLYIADDRRPKQCIANFKTFFGPLTYGEKQYLRYCAERNMRFIEQTLRCRLTPEQVQDDELFALAAPWLERRGILPFDREDWDEAFKGVDFSFGERFHGNVFALWNNVKALFLVSDSRTREMTEFFRLPSMEMNEFDAEKPVQYYYEKADYSEFNKYYPLLFKNFQEFAKKNGLPFSERAEPLVFQGRSGKANEAEK